MESILIACLFYGVIAGDKVQKISPINENTLVEVDPKSQNIPLDTAFQHLRPPKPRVPDVDQRTIFIGLSAFRDGYRCGKTIFTGYKRAVHPELLYFGVIDQLAEGDSSCLDSYCSFAKAEWPEEECKYKSHLRMDVRTATSSRGPTLARHYQQQLVGEEEFCLQLDGHSIFTNKWDENLLNDWLQADNEMAVLSTYLHDIHDFVLPNGDNKPPSQLPHLCKTKRGSRGMIRNEGASMIHNPLLPQMSALWGAGLSFSKCHAEKRALVDSHTLWMFDGEEFLRASHLWTNGYDIYSPSRLGAVVYHNYSKVPQRFEYIKVPQKQRDEETMMGANRFKLQVGIPFKGIVDATELIKYDFGKTRTFQHYLNFSGVTFEEGKTDNSSCYQLHWRPYDDPSEIEKLLPGWKMHPESKKRQVVRSKNGDTFARLEEENGGEGEGGDGGGMADLSNEDHAQDTHKLRQRNSQRQNDVNKQMMTWSTFQVVGVIGFMILFVIVYSNDRYWIRVVRIFRSKHSSVRQ